MFESVKKAKIEIDYQRTLNQADDIEEIATQLNSLATGKYGGSLQNIGANWKGERANQYLTKAGQVKTDLIQSAKELKTLANDIREAAKRVYQKEMESLKIVESRDY